MSSLNIGNLDRLLRVALGLVLIGLTLTGTIGAWGYAGVALLLTGAVAFCPLYRLLGIATTAR